MQFLKMVEGLEERPLPRARARVDDQGRRATIRTARRPRTSLVILFLRHGLFLPLLEFLGVRIRSVVVKVSHAPSGSARSGLVYHDPRQKVCRREIAVSERVGFVGLGIMGGPMARNLADAGFELSVFNRSSSKAEKL